VSPQPGSFSVSEMDCDITSISQLRAQAFFGSQLIRIFIYKLATYVAVLFPPISKPPQAVFAIFLVNLRTFCFFSIKKKKKPCAGGSHL
jgi:hypothetical protein